MNCKEPTIVLCVAALLIGAAGCSTGPKTEGDKTALASSTTAALNGFKAADPTLNELLNKSAGMVIFPEVGKAGFVVGGSYGRGEVFEHGAKIGYADIKQATFGLQIGAQTFSELVIFMKDEDVAQFKRGEFSLAANVSAVAIKPGVAATTDTGKGVIVFVRTSGGLMAEASVGGQVSKFQPLCSRLKHTEYAPGRRDRERPGASTDRENVAKTQTGGDEKRLNGKKYERELRKLQSELCMLQDWVKYKGLRVILVFEGRDAAGKGGVIKAITERVSPRVFRLVALPAPSDREKSQMYIQRYMQHFPAAGEIVIFDRSWYNRAGVEYVMGFCTKEQHRRFLELCPVVKKYIVDGGILLIKVWLEVSDKEQKRRFEARIDDPLRQWKLSPMDLPSRSKWFEYSRARDMMLDATDTRHAPWFVLRSDDKKRARLNCIRHILDSIPHKKAPREKVKLPKRSMKGAYDDQVTLKKRKFVPEKY